MIFCWLSPRALREGSTERGKSISRTFEHTRGSFGKKEPRVCLHKSTKTLGNKFVRTNKKGLKS